MQLDRNSLDKLLKLNDKQLMSIIKGLAADSGIDPASLNININDISSLRSALSSATDEDLKKVAEQYEANKRAKGKR